MEHILKARIDRIEKNENETNARLRKIEVDKVRNRHVHAKQLADKQAERDQVYEQMQLEQMSARPAMLLQVSARSESRHAKKKHSRSRPLSLTDALYLQTAERRRVEGN